MSMNLHINASGIVIYPSGKSGVILESFKCAQTPSRITHKILESQDPIQAYKDWIKEIWPDTEEDVYDFDGWDDKIDDYPIIGKKPCSPSTEHIERLDAFLAQIKEKGLTLDIYAM